MRRVLVLVGLAIGTTITLVAQPSSVEATHIQVYAFMFMPTGSTSPASQAVMDCGWHTNCDGIYGDAMGGLDWRWIDTPPQTQTRLRLRLLASGGTTHVANGQSFNTSGACPYLKIYFQRISDGSVLGRIDHYHSVQAPGTVYYTWYASNPSLQYDSAVGSMTAPNVCSSYYHVMQQIIPYSQTNLLSKNSNIPNEQGCFRCGLHYPVWSIADAIFGFRAQ